MKIDRRENLIPRYLLGELAEADHTALEQELPIDRGKFDQVWAVENELVDSYVRGEMYRPARERFESRYQNLLLLYVGEERKALSVIRNSHMFGQCLVDPFNRPSKHFFHRNAAATAWERVELAATVSPDWVRDSAV